MRILGKVIVRRRFALVAISALFLACSFALVLLNPTIAHAQKPTSQTTEYSLYEKEAIIGALKNLDLEIDKAPEGKIINQIQVVRLEVLEARDPGPELLKKVPVVSPVGVLVTKPMLNWLHVLSKEWIIRREFLLHEGDPYVQVIIDETARNMRSRMPLQVSLVVILPVRSKSTPLDPNKIDLLVITKDIWSLRLSFDMAITPGGLENFIIVPQETNFLGLHHTAQTRFQMQPETVSLGVGYKIPRFGYSWIGAGASAGVTINRRRSEPEGSSIGVSVGQGLYSTRTDWAWDADVGYTVGVARRYSNAQVFAFDSRLTRERERIPFQYKSRSFGASASVTRSFGWALKNNFSLSFNATTADYSLFPEDLNGISQIAANDFRSRVLPTSESRVYPAISWSSFTTNFLRTLDINTLALQEDYRLGHNFGVTIYPVPRALGSSRDLIGVSAKAGYSVALGDGLAGASVSTFAEDAGGIITDGSVSVSVGAITPRIFGFGRIAMNSSFNSRYRNYLNSRAFIGGEDRLRGYPTAYFFGKDTVFYNIEYRSRSVEILKAAVGGVLFYDAADAANGIENLRAKQSVGFGARILFPQVNRLVLRLDFAFPMNRGPFPETGSPLPVDPFGFYFAFDQAFAP
jgi:outer membrane protein assembly factor BamA